MEQWYYSTQGQQPTGPVSFDEVKQLVAAGKLAATDMVWHTKAKDWLPVAKAPELAGLLRSSKPASAPAAPPKQAVEQKPAVETKPVIEQKPVETPASVEVRSGKKAARSGGFLSTLQSALPKPVLFGIYGGLGGLLGALLFGEALWAMLRPTPRELQPLRMVASQDVIVYPGNENKITVKVARLGNQGSVRLVAVSPPENIKVNAVTIPSDKNEGEMTVSVPAEVKVGQYPIEVRGTASETKYVATKTVQVKVEPYAQLSVSDGVTVYAGDKNKFSFKIRRSHFEGPTRIEVLDLPQGVTIPVLTIPENKDEGVLDVAAAKDAALGEFERTVEIRSVNNSKIRGTDKFFLTIQPPPGKLQMSVAKQITIYPGDKNKFTVLIARSDFVSPVQVEVQGLPPDVQAPSVTIPADKTEAELQLTVGKSYVGKAATSQELSVVATAAKDETLTVSKPLMLKIEPPPPAIQLAVSPKVAVYAGGKATFGVKVARFYGFNGPVRVEIGKHKHVSAPAVVIPADQTDGEVTVDVDPSALALKLPQTMPVQLTGRGGDAKTGPTSTEVVQLSVVAPPSELRLTVSPEVEVHQGGRCRFSIKAARAGFIGPVKLSFAKVPEGVDFTENIIPANTDELTLDGRALIESKVGTYDIKLTGVGPKAADGKVPTATANFTLHVKPLDPSKRPPPLDIVFLLDVSNSMDPQIKGVRDGVQQFLAKLKDNQLEGRIALVAFRDITKDDFEPLKVLNFGSSPFTDDPKAFSAEVSKLKATGGGDEPESSLDALQRATELPFRDNAYRVLMLITDALPQKSGNSVTMPAALKFLKEKKIDQFHIIVNEPQRKTYEELQQVAKGSFFDLKATSEISKDNPGFASLLPKLSREIARTTVATGPNTPTATKPPPLPAAKDAPSLATAEPPPPPADKPAGPPKVDRPAPPEALAALAQQPSPPPQQAAVASPPATIPTLQGVQSTQAFNPEDSTQLLIATALWSAAIAALIGLALVAGQKLYLQKTLPSLSEAGSALGAGLAAGLLGGAIGQWFLQWTSGVTGGYGSIFNVIQQIISWSILGALLGGGMGFFVPNLQKKRAVIGGAIGGFIGALGFAIFALIASHEMMGRWVGAALLGFCIGIMIGLAEVAFRRYWLEVAYGEREIRTVTLGPATIAVGGDEKLAAVAVPGAPAKALGYRVNGNRVFCENFETDKTAEVSPGDQRKLMNVKITVCSAASARSTGASLKLIQVRNMTLMDGMPLTAEDIPGLEPRGSDGVVALVSRRPNDPEAFLLRNRSKQSWTVTDASGAKRTIEPGLGVELNAACDIDFGPQVKAKLDPGKPPAK